MLKFFSIQMMGIIVVAFQVGCSGESAVTPQATEEPTPEPEPSKAPDAGETKQKRPRRQPARPIKGALPAPSDVAAPPENAERSDSGLAWVVQKKGRGRATPGPYDVVTVDYTGWTAEEGINFDSSVVKGEPGEFRLNETIKGWVEGVQLMKRGEKRRFWIPEELAYKGQPRRPQGMLVFDIELIRWQKAPPLPPVPDDVAAPPESAERSESGLAWRVLSKGRGSKTPGPHAKVKVEFTGWETDGSLFRSTILEGRPSEMPVDRISSKGLSEALRLMKRGEKTRFWIPAELAYKGRPGAPQGMIVMDIEMLSFTE